MRSLALMSMCCAAVTIASSANASSGWLSPGAITPVEQRVAIAAGPSRTVVWTSLRYEGDSAVALVVPAADGAVVDLASDAWFEALEANTAPRVLPPKGGEACPGSSSFPTYDLIGNIEHQRTIAPDEVVVLANAKAVDGWAAARGMPIDAGLDAELHALAPSQFVVVAFPARPNGATTATIRVTTEASDLRVPLSLVRATNDDLLVTTFTLGQGRAFFAPETPASIPNDTLAWFAATGKSSYASAREEVLVGSSETTLTESAGHEDLGNDHSFSPAFDAIDSIVKTYLDRGAAYDPGTFDLTACESSAESAFNGVEPVGKSCPAGALATIGTPPSCDEAAKPGTTPPDALRCGPLLDDLAVGLSGMRPAKVWLTRESLLVESGHGGVDRTLALGSGAHVSSVMTAGFTENKGCPKSNGSGNGSGHGHNGSGIDVNGDGSIDLGTDGGDDGSDSCDGSDSSGGDSCSGSGDGSDSCDSGGGDSCDSGGGEDCSGAGSAGSCNCVFGRAPRPRGSIVVMATAALAALLRRRGSKRRRARASRDLAL